MLSFFRLLRFFLLAQHFCLMHLCVKVISSCHEVWFRYLHYLFNEVWHSLVELFFRCVAAAAAVADSSNIIKTTYWNGGTKQLHHISHTSLREMEMLAGAHTHTHNICLMYLFLLRWQCVCWEVLYVHYYIHFVNTFVVHFTLIDTSRVIANGGAARAAVTVIFERNDWLTFGRMNTV